MIKDINCTMVTSANNNIIVFPERNLFRIPLRWFSRWKITDESSRSQVVRRKSLAVIDDNQPLLVANCGMSAA